MTLDEFRWSTGTRSSGWINTSYNNQSKQGVGAGQFIKTLGSEEDPPGVDITVSVYHTASDGSGATEIITSSSTTIDANTADPYALSIGSGLEQTFTSGDPRRLRMHVHVDAVSGSGSFTLAYDSSSDPSSLDTPVIVVPEGVLPFIALAVLIPIMMGGSRRKIWMKSMRNYVRNLKNRCGVILTKSYGHVRKQVLQSARDNLRRE
jgi:hypothetical protein